MEPSLLVFSLTPPSICSADQLTNTPQISWRKSLIESLLSQTSSHCCTITGWFVKITRRWWEGNDCGKGLCFPAFLQNYKFSSFVVIYSTLLIWTNCCRWLVTGSCLIALRVWGWTQVILNTKRANECTESRLIMDVHIICISGSVSLFSLNQLSLNLAGLFLLFQHLASQSVKSVAVCQLPTKHRPDSLLTAPWSLPSPHCFSPHVTAKKSKHPSPSPKKKKSW